MIKEEKNLLGVIGICRRAGAAVVGFPLIYDRLKSRRGGKSEKMIVFEASDTSENTHKKISDKCSFYKVKHIRLSVDCNELGRAVGKRATSAVAVMGENFCRAVELKLEGTHDSRPDNDIEE